MPGDECSIIVPEIYQNDRISSGVIVHLRASRSARLAVNISHGLEMPLGFREKNLRTLPQMVKIIVHLAIVDRTSHRRSSFRKNAIIIVHLSVSDAYLDEPHSFVLNSARHDWL